MVPVVVQMCPESRYSIKCPYIREPDRIVVHNTANDAPARNEVAYMINRADEVSFHAAADDIEIVQGLPLDRNAWASGDGRGSGNMYGIHIEICYSLSGGERFIKAEKNAAEYIASLLNEYGWGLDKVTKHQDYDGKYCPHRTMDLGWERFLKMIEGYLKGEDDMALTYEQWKEYMNQWQKEQAARAESGWAKEAVQYVKENGIMSGDENGKFRAQSYVTRQELAQVAFNFGNKER